MERLLEAEHLGIAYPKSDFRLEDVNFHIPTGSIVGLIGENGSGKTTTIHLLLGLKKKTSGSVKFFGKEFDGEDSELKERIGVAFDDIVLPNDLNIRQVSNIYKHFYKNWEESFFIDTLANYGIVSDKKIVDYSKGMQKMLTIVLVMSHSPELLILDEPTSSLDPVRRKDFLDLFQGYIEEGEKSILFSSHITSDIEQICDYVLYIKDGRQIFFEPMTKLLYEYSLVRCSAEAFERIPKEDIVVYRRQEYQHVVLLNKAASSGSDYLVEKPGLEEIMNLYAKGAVL